MPDICLPNGSFVFGCSVDEMGKVICFKLLFQSCLVGSIKRDPLHWNSLLYIHNKVTPWGSTTAHLALHLSVVCMISKFTMFIYSLAKKTWILTCFQWSDLKLGFRTLYFSQTKMILASKIHNSAIWWGPQNWHVQTNNKTTLKNLYQCLSSEHNFFILLKCNWFVF